MHSLPIFVALNGRPVILIGDGEAAVAKRRLLERAGAVIVDEQAEAQLAIVAVDDDDEARTAVDRLRVRRILVNAVDRPALCDFTLPAIVDRDPVLIAIGTGGASAGLAKALRQRLETLLPASLGRLADALFAARPAIRARWPDPAQRRRAIDAGLAENGPIDPFHSEPRVVDWIADGAAPAESAAITIRIRSADPDDLTIGQARLLGQADRVFHPADMAPAVLNRARSDARRIAGDAPASPGDGLSIILEWA